MKKSILILSSAILLNSCTLQKFNVDNLEFIEEVAFNLNKTPQQVTQIEFNARYVNN